MLRSLGRVGMIGEGTGLGTRLREDWWRRRGSRRVGGLVRGCWAVLALE